MAKGEKHRDHRRNLLDHATAALVKLITDRDAESASGDFGVLVTMERGDHRRVRVLEEKTVMTAGGPR